MQYDALPHATPVPEAELDCIVAITALLKHHITMLANAHLICLRGSTGLLRPGEAGGTAGSGLLAPPLLLVLLVPE
jgi:hypothetical protein